MAKKQFNGLIFDGRENENYKEKLIEYLEGLPTANSPFNCTNLRVLPLDVKLINSYGPSDTLESGALICLYHINGDLFRGRCGITHSELINKEGHLVFKCLVNKKTRIFETKLVDFKESVIKNLK